jgi:hypothetical protein
LIRDKPFADGLLMAAGAFILAGAAALLEHGVQCLEGRHMRHRLRATVYLRFLIIRIQINSRLQLASVTGARSDRKCARSHLLGE